MPGACSSLWAVSCPARNSPSLFSFPLFFACSKRTWVASSEQAAPQGWVQEEEPIRAKWRFQRLQRRECNSSVNYLKAPAVSFFDVKRPQMVTDVGGREKGVPQCTSHLYHEDSTDSSGISSKLEQLKPHSENQKPKPYFEGHKSEPANQQSHKMNY